MVDLKTIKKVHFIGIGGIGISAIARMMLGEGKEVSGSDGSTSFITEELSKLGITIYLGHEAEHIVSGTDLVIYTIAITPDNPEFQAAEKLGIPRMSYPEILGLISANKYTVAIAGTHGKTTTTAMLSQIALAADKEPTVIVGSILKDKHSNFIAGKSDLFIVEACEYRRSFLNINPMVIIITNIDNDHLDYYKDLADIQSAFKELVQKIPKHGAVICKVNDPALKPVIENIECQVIDYASFEGKITLQVPGEHNQENAKAALAAASVLEIDEQEALRALGTFAGTWRRFEYKGTTATGALVYTDYGHHPTEIKAVLKAARETAVSSGGRVLTVFQPHLYSRTKLLLEDFSQSFVDADEVWIADIYGAREQVDDTIHTRMLVEGINRDKATKAHYGAAFEDILKELRDKAKLGDLILVLGAGTIDTLAEKLAN